MFLIEWLRQLRGCEENLFDGHVANKATGERLVVSRPTLHCGFVLQAEFDIARRVEDI